MAEVQQEGKIEEEAPAEVPEMKQGFLDDVDPADFLKGLQEMKDSSNMPASPNQDRSVSLEADAEAGGRSLEIKEEGHSHHSSSHTNDLNKAVLIEAEGEGSLHVPNLNLAQEIGPEEVGSSPGPGSDRPPGIGDSLEDSKQSQKGAAESEEPNEKAGHKRSQFAPSPAAFENPMLSEERNRPVDKSKGEKEVAPESERVLNALPTPESRSPECAVQSESLDVKCCSGCRLI